MAKENESKSDIIFIKGKAMWPKLFVPDQPPKGKKWTPKWTIDVLLDKEGLAQAEALNLAVETKKDNYRGIYEGYTGAYIRINRAVKNFKGDAVEQPVVKDRLRNDWAPNVKIGNGSDVKVKALVKNMNPNDEGKFGTYLLAVQVINLVKFESQGEPEEDFVEEEGNYETPEDFDFDEGDDIPPFDGANPINAG